MVSNNVQVFYMSPNLKSKQLNCAPALRLKELVLTEEAKISGFKEKGPQTKEKRLKELENFIKEGIEKGFSTHEIRSLLIKKKWPKDIVESTIKKVG